MRWVTELYPAIACVINHRQKLLLRATPEVEDALFPCKIHRDRALPMPLQREVVVMPRNMIVNVSLDLR